MTVYIFVGVPVRYLTETIGFPVRNSYKIEYGTHILSP